MVEPSDGFAIHLGVGVTPRNGKNRTLSRSTGTESESKADLRLWLASRHGQELKDTFGESPQATDWTESSQDGGCRGWESRFPDGPDEFANSIGYFAPTWMNKILCVDLKPGIPYKP